MSSFGSESTTDDVLEGIDLTDNLNRYAESVIAATR